MPDVEDVLAGPDVPDVLDVLDVLVVDDEEAAVAVSFFAPPSEEPDPSPDPFGPDPFEPAPFEPAPLAVFADARESVL